MQKPNEYKELVDFFTMKFAKDEAMAEALSELERSPKNTKITEKDFFS